MDEYFNTTMIFPLEAE
jgi:hypothetical protein